jgi:hypothetical protein
MLKLLTLSALADRPFVVLLLLAAVACRGASVLMFQNDQVSDAVMYDRLARGLISGEGYVLAGRPSAWWPVGYPAALAVVYAIAGAHALSGKLFNVVIGTLSVWLCYRLTSRVSRSGGRLAGLAVAVLPSHVLASNLLTTETLATAVLLAAALMLWPPHSRRAALAGGLLVGLGALVRPVMLLIGPAWLAACVAFPRYRRSTLQATPVFVLGLAIAIGPWAIRNWMALGTPVLVSTNDGYIMWAGNNPLATGTYLLTNGVHAFAYAQRDPGVDRQAGEVARDRAYRERALAFIRAEPAAFVTRAVTKLRYLWATDNDAVSWLLDGLSVSNQTRQILYVSLHSAALGAYWIVLVAGGMAVLRSRHTPLGDAWLLTVPVVVVTAVHAVLLGDDRFHFPVLPFLAALGAVGLSGHLIGPADPGLDSSSGPEAEGGSTLELHSHHPLRPRNVS